MTKHEIAEWMGFAWVLCFFGTMIKFTLYAIMETKNDQD